MRGTILKIRPPLLLLLQFGFAGAVALSWLGMTMGPAQAMNARVMPNFQNVPWGASENVFKQRVRKRFKYVSRSTSPDKETTSLHFSGNLAGHLAEVYGYFLLGHLTHVQMNLKAEPDQLGGIYLDLAQKMEGLYGDPFSSSLKYRDDAPPEATDHPLLENLAGAFANGLVEAYESWRYQDTDFITLQLMHSDGEPDYLSIFLNSHSTRVRVHKSHQRDYGF